MDFKQLEVFVAVCKYQSFSKSFVKECEMESVPRQCVNIKVSQKLHVNYF